MIISYKILIDIFHYTNYFPILQKLHGNFKIYVKTAIQFPFLIYRGAEKTF
jgi:hypothetical protein